MKCFTIIKGGVLGISGVIFPSGKVAVERRSGTISIYESMDIFKEKHNLAGGTLCWSTLTRGSKEQLEEPSDPDPFTEIASSVREVVTDLRDVASDLMKEFKGLFNELKKDLGSK